MTSSPKIALISGANKGIGFETARMLAAAGYRVYIGCRDIAKGHAAIAALGQPDLDLRAIALDVTDAASAHAAAATIKTESGHLDVLINNAGISIEMLPPSKATVAALRTTYETNVFGPVTLTQAVLPLLHEGQTRVIVNLSSELGSLTLHGYPDFIYDAYNAMSYNSSKAALNAFTVLLAKELRSEGFRVNSVNPGFTATDLNQHRGTRTVEQAATVVIKYATLDTTGPTGGFFTEGGAVPW